MLSGPRQKFCEGVVSGLNATQAYLAAYPRSDEESARRAGSRLLSNDDVIAEIENLRIVCKANVTWSVQRKLKFLEDILEAKPEQAAFDNPLCDTAMTKMGPQPVFPQKLAALKMHNDLCGEGSEAKGSEGLAGLTALIERIRK